MNIENLEEVLAKTDLEFYEQDRVLLMVQERIDKGWDDDEYVLHSALVDSDIEKRERETIKDAILN
jgi:hypothetical protein